MVFLFFYPTSLVVLCSAPVIRTPISPLSFFSFHPFLPPFFSFLSYTLLSFPTLLNFRHISFSERLNIAVLVRDSHTHTHTLSHSHPPPKSRYHSGVVDKLGCHGNTARQPRQQHCGDLEGGTASPSTHTQSVFVHTHIELMYILFLPFLPYILLSYLLFSFPSFRSSFPTS